MIAPRLVRKLAIGILVIAVPGIACHGYYAYEAAADASTAWRVAIVLAYPAVLIALAWALVWLCNLANRPRE